VPRPPRPRRKQREQDRALRKQVRRTEQLAGKLRGASPDHPIDVASASVVEGKARATPCVQCGGELELGGDRATSSARGLPPLPRPAHAVVPDRAAGGELTGGSMGSMGSIGRATPWLHIAARRV
jgi:hypothetical protein